MVGPEIEVIDMEQRTPNFNVEYLSSTKKIGQIQNPQL